MRLNEQLRSLLRRPLALLLILAVAAGGAFYGWTHATNTYQSSATVLIVPAGIDVAGAADGTAPDNPLTRLDDNIAQLALVVGSQLSSDAVRAQVVSVGGDGDYTADNLGSGATQRSPLVTITASSATPEGAQRAISVLVDQAGAQLAAVQSASNVANDARAQAVLSTPATASAVVGDPQQRSAGVFGIAAGLAALLLMIAARLVLGRRQPAPPMASGQSTPPPGRPSRPGPRPGQGRSAQGRSTQGRPAQSQVVQSQVVQSQAAQSRATQQQPAPVSARRPAFEDAGRFAPPSAEAPIQTSPSQAPALQPARSALEPTAADPVLPGNRRRQEVLRDMVRDEWQRSGSNVAWTRREQRDAYERAEDRLIEIERRRRDIEVESVGHFDDFLEYRAHG